MMKVNLLRRRYLLLWQILLLLLGTTWLWAPHLNHFLSFRTALVSQYETSFEPYSWLFRVGDFLAGGLVVILGYFINSKKLNRNISVLVIIVGAGMMLDPVFSTTCRQIGNACQEYFSISFLLHAVETVVTSAALFWLAVYDAWVRKRVVSIAYVIFQIGYGLLFISQLANQQRFNTLSQFIYELSIIAWLAWFGRDYLRPTNFPAKKNELAIVKNLTASWAFLNGLLAILVSLAHIHLLGRIKGFYFAGDSAWLAQHGVIVGIVMIYISRHLARGERRARQIFLTVVGIEVLKYSVISPNPGLLALYGLTFCALFVFRDDFQRGTVPLTWQMRLRDLYFMAASLMVAALVVLISLDRDNRVALVTGRAFDHFYDYALGNDNFSRSHRGSVLLAHTLTAFILTAVATLLWILFKPYKTRSGMGRDYQRIQELLEQYSESSEDFFKLWPRDKDFFWSDDGKSFIAYKREGAVLFALADPIGPRKTELAHSFLEWAQGRRLRVCFLPVYEPNATLYKDVGLDLLQMGSSALIKPEVFLNTTANDKWWRWKRNRAEKGGYEYEVSPGSHSPELLNELRKVSDAWLEFGGHAERGFALGFFSDNYLKLCKIHYLKNEDGKIIAFANELPQFRKSQTATIDLLRYLPDHDDSMPYLLYKTIGSVYENGYEYFDLGFVPFAKAEGSILAIAQALGGSRFSSKGLEQFKNKFDPQWQANYLAYDGDLTDLALIALNIERVMDANL